MILSLGVWWVRVDKVGFYLINGYVPLTTILLDHSDYYFIEIYLTYEILHIIIIIILKGWIQMSSPSPNRIHLRSRLSPIYDLGKRTNIIIKNISSENCLEIV